MTGFRLFVSMAALAAVLLVAGCGSGDPSPSPTTATGSPPAATATPGGSPVEPVTSLRTFAVRPDSGCDTIGVDNPVTGVLTGDPEDPQEPIWLVEAGGRRMSVVWPAGFAVAFDPDARLLNESGVVVASAGDVVVLTQVNGQLTPGTYDEPYIAEGILLDGCYVRRD